MHSPLFAVDGDQSRIRPHLLVPVQPSLYLVSQAGRQDQRVLARPVNVLAGLDLGTAQHLAVERVTGPACVAHQRADLRRAQLPARSRGPRSEPCSGGSPTARHQRGRHTGWIGPKVVGVDQHVREIFAYETGVNGPAGR
jgi:hypothetical protein